MPFNAKSEEEYQKGGGDFGILPEDSYIFEVTGFEDKGRIPDRFDRNDPPRLLTDIRFFAKPLSYADDTETPLIDDKTKGPLNPDKSIMIFFKPESLGFGPSGPSKNRKFMAAALGRPIRDRFDGVEYQDFVGGKFIGDVAHKNGYDNIVDFRPLKKAARQRPTLVEEAAKVFGASEDELPF
jgi:hypothetical protein